MTDTQLYDGSGKLGDAIAKLYGCSPKNNNRIAELVANAKTELGIVSKTKKLPDDVKLAIYQLHHDRLHPATNNAVEIISHDDSNESVELYSHPARPDSVETISQPELPLPVDIISQSGGNEVVEINSQPNDLDIVRVAFYVTKDGARPRQVIALDDFYIKALMLATGITRQDVPKWVQQAVDGWAAFDGKLPITRQVKLLLIRELTAKLERLKQD